MSGRGALLWPATDGATKHSVRAFGSTITRDLGSRFADIISVADYAVGDGSADDTEGIAAAAVRAGGRLLVFPKGTWLTSETIALPGNCSVFMDTGAIVRATAAMDAVFTVGTIGSGAGNKTFEGAAYIDCDGLADRGIWVTPAHWTVRDVIVRDPVLYGVHFDGGYGGYAQGVKVENTGAAMVAGTIGFHVESSDGSLFQCLSQGQERGFKCTSAQNRFLTCHAWSAVASTGWMLEGFTDTHSGNAYIGCEADTPQNYGFRFTAADSTVGGHQIIGCKVLLPGPNATTLVGVKFDAAAPIASVLGNHFRANDAGNPIAKDVEATAYGAIRIAGNVHTNVTTMRAQIASAFSHTETWDPSSIAAGAFTSLTATVPGAVVGDHVLVTHSGLGAVSGVQMSGAVTAADTVKVTACSSSGAGQDIASGTVRITLLRVAP